MVDRSRRLRMGPERRLRILLLAMATAASLASAGVVASLSVSVVLRACLTMATALGWFVMAWVAYESIARPLQGLVNVVEALRAGDYSVHGRSMGRGEPLGDVIDEVNQLAEALREQRLRAMEATALLEQLLATVDVAVLAVDGRSVVRLVNSAAAGLLGRPAAEILGRTASELGIADLVASDLGTRVIDAVAWRAGRWQVTHGAFREAGLVQHLLVVTDLRRALRAEEHAAWEKLARVMGHEVRNSLAPIRSLAGTVRTLLERALPQGSLRADALEGLQVIEDRSASLARFLTQYRRLAQLPAPNRTRTALGPLLRRVAALTVRPQVELNVEELLFAEIDPDLIEQALVNLLQNAVDAAGPDGKVAVEAVGSGEAVRIWVTDDGPGVTSTGNLFVPFFTTKPGGSGIGLALSRQIAEAHGGSLALENRAGTRGAVATLELPAAGRAASIRN